MNQYQMKFRGYKEAYRRNQEIKRQMKSIGSDDQKLNQLNVAVLNTMLTIDRRIEMGIIAMRQRRRFKQVRRLGIKVPDSYVRVHSIKSMPKIVQNELV